MREEGQRPIRDLASSLLLHPSSLSTRINFSYFNTHTYHHMAQLRPLGGNILVKRLEAETVTKSGIVLPDSAKEKPKRGTVQAIGDGKLLDSGEKSAFSVKKGDEVLFTSYAGTEVKIDGDELLIMSEDDVLAVVS